jgi:ankyrin repeat protein
VFVKTITFLACVGFLTQAAPVESRPETTEIFQSIRRGDLPGMRLALQKGGDVNGRDADGSTPLMYAALYLPDAAGLRQLMKHGADPNAANAFGATALIWATGSLEKVKLLVEHGADVNARSKLGKTALLVAASRDGAGPVVSYLLAHGARADVKDDLNGLPGIPVGGGGTSALIQAAKARDGEALAALLKSGAAVNEKEKNGSTALLNAIASQNHGNIQLLLARGADVNAATNPVGFSPLILAAMRDDLATVSSLIARGAKIDAEDTWGNTALMWAAFSEQANPELVNILLKSGADLNHKNKMGETAWTWATRRGETKIVALLKPGAAAPEREQPAALTTVSFAEEQSLFAAIDKGLPMLQKAGPAVFQQRGCVSCHNNMLPSIAAMQARGQGHKIDEAAMEREQQSVLSILKPARELLLENGDNIPDLPMTAPYALMTLAAQGYRADLLTDAVVHNLANKQSADGSWTIWAARPPIEYGDIQATALCLRALQLYPLQGRQAEFEARVQKAGQWLANTHPESTSDLNWKLLGLFWSKADARLIAQAAQPILRNQRGDGGWAQLPGLSTDAYATGQTLYALSTTNVANKTSDPWSRGIDYLLRTQQADGTWRVKSRSFPFQPYFESGFPYGPDQWISAAGSSWAIIALTMANDDSLMGKKSAGDVEALVRRR